MKEVIKPTSKAEKDKEGKDMPIEYILEDKDFLLITAINNLTKELMKGRQNGR
jgi:hypothetical protein